MTVNRGMPVIAARENLRGDRGRVRRRDFNRLDDHGFQRFDLILIQRSRHLFSLMLSFKVLLQVPINTRLVG